MQFSGTKLISYMTVIDAPQNSDTLTHQQQLSWHII